jgi:ferredoxin-NADP reductase/ferredoxin
MQGMMGGMMGRPKRPFYSTLMDMPRLSPEARQYIEQEAQQRLGTGAQSIIAGESTLHRALGEKDVAAMQKAAAVVRQGLLQVESGAAALRALNEGQEPRQIALTWFKGQLGLPANDQPPLHAEPFGLSWYHLTVMVFLGMFVLGTLLIHVARVRRVSSLVARLANRPAAPAPSGGPPQVMPGAPPTPSALPPSAPPPTGSPAPSNGGAAASRTSAAPRRPWSGTLRVAAIFRETHDTKTFRMVNPQDGAIPFAFLPGQFLTFSIEIEGKRLRRSYTIASSPAQTGYIEVTVKRQEHHGVSAYLHDHVVAGSLVEVTAPAGRFTFTGESADSIVLIAGGVGITPMMSVTRYLTDTSYAGEIFLLFGARTTDDFIFREELEYLQRRHENLHIAATMSRAAGTAWMGPEGPVSKEFIAHTVPEIARRHIHLCGPPPMMDVVKAELAELGVPREQVETEAFGPAEGMAPADSLPAHPPEPIPQPAGAAAGVSPALARTGNGQSRPAVMPEPAVPRAGNGHAQPLAGAQIRFTLSNRTGLLLANQSVLEAAEVIGVDIDYSCRVGTCGTCKVRLLEGAVTMEVEEGLDPGDKERGLILACQAKSPGNLVVEA